MLSSGREEEVGVEGIGKKYKVIIDYEESFARAVARRVQMMKPLSVWQLLIPFVFIFDFLRLKAETETFARNFLFIKKLALDAAFENNKGEDRPDKLVQIEDEARKWLVSKNFFSQRILQGQMGEISLLIDHYSRLLDAEGDNYPSLVRGAYQTREHFADFLQKLSSAEKEIDRAVITILEKKEGAREVMLAKQKVIDEIRASSVCKFFSEPKGGQ
ncbi:NF038143 family protein [Chloroflexota bacterium]